MEEVEKQSKLSRWLSVILDFIRHFISFTLENICLYRHALQCTEVMITVSLNAGILSLWDINLGKYNKEESLNYPSNWMHTKNLHFVGRSSGASAILIENGYEKRLKLKPLFLKSWNLVSNSSFSLNIRLMYFRELQMLWFRQNWKMHRVPVFSLWFQKK